ncbi:hypothetical protein [Pontibacillus salipaludis]|uniref:Uncharacterized protein n=1 Tax=Pontibacillus salipaludis TaxID=1697394 RepID=A0ABQ1PRY5_9BACI|nr:hypothetical protein [Pontibacillus salipaludis]GGD02301.1 hypothetical protein GCM10011389_07180 [Pontibacillus salipaludis]
MKTQFMYETFKRQKEAGNLKQFNEVTKEELKEMFYHEIRTDEMIAYLFDVEKKIVTKKRYDLGLKINILEETEGPPKAMIDEYNGLLEIDKMEI